MEQLLLVAGSATAFVAFAFDWVWPFGFLAVLFGMGHALCWLVRETVAPGPRGALHRLWALLSFGALLSVLLYLVECHLELYG
ncbi:MAG: hypothetical protein HC824_07600 [Synechococcales cyanobacterium RM1_1_8]|nr:hypothetical protein [Synechococcales cyanobacterium RM1_1_8]